MAGIQFNFEVQDNGVSAALKNVIAAAERPRGAFMAVGNYLIRVHRQRFSDQVDPDGNPWAALDPEYARSKRKQKSRGANLILVLNAYLANHFRYQYSDGDLFFGSDREYAATHQFGAPARGIPARPFLGISDDNQEHIIGIFNRYLRDAWDGSKNLV